MVQVIPFAVYEVVTNHPLLREVEYESFEEVASCESENVSMLITLLLREIVYWSFEEKVKSEKVKVEMLYVSMRVLEL